MSEKEKKIMETFEKVIPSLSEDDKRELLAFGEGMAFVKKHSKTDPAETE